MSATNDQVIEKIIFIRRINPKYLIIDPGPVGRTVRVPALGGGRESRGAPEVRNMSRCHVMMLMFREMWSLFNLDDTKSLRISDLVQGVTSVCQLDNQEFFDFYPAVRFVKNL